MAQTKEKAVAYDLGQIIEIDVCPHKKTSKKRRAAWKPTSEAQRKVNQRKKQRYVSRLVNLNFDRSAWMLTLDYADGWYEDSIEDAKRDMQNWIRRIRPLYKKAGAELKYIYCTERGEDTGRVHNHVIISGGVDKGQLLQAWRKGQRMYAAHLEYTENGYADLGTYVAKKQERWERSYSASKNLDRPKALPEDDKIVRRISKAFTKKQCEALLRHDITREELAALLPGYKVCDGWQITYNPYDRGYYIHMRLIDLSAAVVGWATTRGSHPGDDYPWAYLQESERKWSGFDDESDEEGMQREERTVL